MLSTPVATDPALLRSLASVSADRISADLMSDQQTHRREPVS